ncbi:MAG: hypothetical protein FJ225_04255 [Lentisphaerae bacterium]|nr:hypothetical protein [Lentisphaerota bacterium]
MPTPREVVLINGIYCANSAAKFWPRLIAEAENEFPEATAVRLSALAAGRLNRDLLHPERALAREIERMLFRDTAEALRRTMAELEATGPPGAVRLRVLAGDAELAARDLPADCVDAEILPYLIAWPMEWAAIPEERWNDPAARGRFTAETLREGRRRAMEFTVTGRHLSEGLYERAITLQFSAAAGAAKATAP